MPNIGLIFDILLVFYSFNSITLISVLSLKSANYLDIPLLQEKYYVNYGNFLLTLNKGFMISFNLLSFTLENIY
jgi:hypothetical protein